MTVTISGPGLRIALHDDGPTSTVTFTVDMLTVALLMASILYMFCVVLVRRKLTRLRSVSMTTKKLLVLSVGVVCLLRIMTILGVAAMNVANVRAHYSLHPPDASNQDFYDKSMMVLFDLPNCIVVSTYVLLSLVWLELFMEMRFTTENLVQWKKAGLLGYMAFNAALYATQLVLYLCIFFAPSDRILRTIVYAAITGTNFTSVFFVVLLYMYLNVRFSGFPFRSDQSRRSFQRVSSVMALWSITRIVWGLATLLVFVYKIELLQDSHTPMWSFLVLLLLLFVCEILPIVAMLDYSYVSMIGLEQSSPRDVVSESVRVRPADLLILQQEPLLHDADRESQEVLVDGG